MSDDLLFITEEKIDITRLYNALDNPGCGVQLIFVGVVRGENDGRQVNSVKFEAFKELAEERLHTLAREARTIFPGPLKLAIAHRVGLLAVGEVCTVIGVAAPHRAECYEASRYLIEQLKTRIPVWKEEHYVDGDSTWLDGTALVAQDCGCSSCRR